MGYLSEAIKERTSDMLKRIDQDGRIDLTEVDLKIGVRFESATLYDIRCGLQAGYQACKVVLHGGNGQTRVLKDVTGVSSFKPYPEHQNCRCVIVDDVTDVYPEKSLRDATVEWWKKFSESDEIKKMMTALTAHTHPSPTGPSAPPLAAIDSAKYPDICPSCGAPSYNGSLFGGVDCSENCKG